MEDRLPEDIEVMYVPGKDISPEIINDADALVVRTRTRCDESLLKNSKVKLLTTATIGTDHIDIPWCEKHGITVKSAPGCNAPGVAQYVFSSIFRTGFNPNKDILGIIGFGNVGSKVAEWAHEMNIRTLISDAPRESQGLKDIEYLPMEEVLRQADAVTLHVPLTYEGNFPTFHMIGQKELGFMKPGSILVNSSRGGVVDEKSLKPMLKSGKLKAILDVWENEPQIDEELAEMVSIATPHIAGYSSEGKKRATRMVLEALNECLGLPIDLKGLECIPDTSQKITTELILKSYDPFIDSKRLLKNLQKFEELRNEYSYRHEPLFS